jgi:uncharacterized membrane protein
MPRAVIDGDSPVNWRSWVKQLSVQLSYFGLFCGALCFALSLSPSLLPRHELVQGLLSGLAFAVGYGLGTACVWLWNYLELQMPGERTIRVVKWLATPMVLVVVLFFLWRATVWQNSICELMEMPPLERAYAPVVILVALVVAGIALAVARLLLKCLLYAEWQLNRFLPPRVSRLLSILLMVLTLFTITNKLLVRQALNFADSVFLAADRLIDEGIPQPVDAAISGSPKSLIDWDSIGRRGKVFLVSGPTEAQISAFSGRTAKRPVRVYAGLDCGGTAADRAELALKDLIRAGGFERSVLVVATPTGTGWLDPGAVDTLEYLHDGDTAIVSMQYSYLPSWITILVEPESSADAARCLFDRIYGHWRTLSRKDRPKLYLHGLSLGALGSETCADLFTLFEDPIQGGVWSGPPFPSENWRAITKGRNPDSPAWLPTFRDGAMVRFTGRENELRQAGKRWGPMRFVYIQHASDPMTFFSPDLLYRNPEWLTGVRGPDVSPFLTWYPLITFLQIAFDLPMATSVPHGYGHNMAPASYIDAWVEVTEPAKSSEADIAKLKQLFAE